MTAKEFIKAFNSLMVDDSYIQTYDVDLTDISKEEIERIYHHLIINLSNIHLDDNRTPEHAARMETIIRGDIRIIQKYLHQNQFKIN